MSKTFNSERSLVKEYGVLASKIAQRLSELKAASNLSLISHLPPPRLHQLEGQRKSQYAVDLNGSMRLIFTPADEPLPVVSDGGIDKARVTEILVIGVENYHG